ncbi:Ribonuclease/ribotoxin [Jimgerdemannia flammicorona]|uniref:Ribonuclease/ribotoxin n=1 Tax=Jimgerdemannia flammicorona TaxID=994334 RepID=A0A433A1Z9_9FUNG|nr:Ribonuclease/ribotoxin [Jimgerdemannia flammicorona]
MKTYISLKYLILFYTVVVLSLAVVKAAADCQCDGIYIIERWVNGALTSGVEHIGAPINGYPHIFHNRENIPFPCETPYYEFPMLENDIYDGGNHQGPHRVVFKANGTFCGGITHPYPPPNNDFVKCHCPPTHVLSFHVQQD